MDGIHVTSRADDATRIRNSGHRASLICGSLNRALALFVFVGSSLASAAEESVQQALLTVTTATHYSWGWVGTPAAPTAAETSSRELYRRASSEQLLAAFDGATNEGKMYLLCVLKRKAPQDFDLAQTRLRNASTQSVTIFTGNVLTRIPMRTLVRNIKKHSCEMLDERFER